MNHYVQQSTTNVRDSNLELFRIITMLLIVAHHYVVNSGLIEVIENNPISNQSIFLLIFGAWGKTAINCFLLITGYFMCKSNISLNKILKLLFVVEFYKILFFLIFYFTGYAKFSPIGLAKALLPITLVRHNFIGCFFIFYLCIPFLNLLINNMNKKQHSYLILLSLFTYTILGSIPKFQLDFNYIGWFCVLYFIGSYIRNYPYKMYENKVFRITTLLCFIALSLASIILLNNYFLQKEIHKTTYFLLNDSNKILAILTAISSFIFFKYLKFPYNKLINTVSATTFGVLLIHANSDTMRQCLWKDFLNNVGQYGTDNMYMHAILSVICIFAVCSIIDFIRIKLLEQPLFKYLDKRL